VRGGIFDRIELLQDGQGVRFRDREHTRLQGILATGAPRLREIGLFIVPEDFAFDQTAPFELQLLVQRDISAREKAALQFNLGYNLPETYLLPLPEPVAQPAPAPDTQPTPGIPAEYEDADLGPPLWVTMWQMNRVQVGIVATALLALTAIFFFQNTLTRRPRLLKGVRYTYLAFILL